MQESDRPDLEGDRGAFAGRERLGEALLDQVAALKTVSLPPR
jgi:hypothetical protein